jgi:hypothetical protein
MNKPERKPAKAAKPVDPRHRETWRLLWDYWQAEHNELVPELPWSAGDAGALAAFLRANPRLSSDGIARLLQHRLDSDDHARGEPVRLWIGSLSRYANGPLNQYRQPKRSNNNGQPTRADQRTQYAADATRAALRRVSGMACR